MASVFLSYVRADVARARSIAQALEKAGHSVWWDRHIKGGAQYSKEIEEALGRAEAIVVLWSKQAVESPWVRDEAAAGRDKGRLVPASIDGTPAPLGFRQYQTVDFSNGRGRARLASLEELCRAVDAVAIGAGVPVLASQPEARTGPRPSRLRLLLLGLAALLVAGAAYFAWQRWPGQASTLVVAVAAGDSSSQSRLLARDLLIKVGSLQAARSDVFRLVEGSTSTGTRPDLILEAGATANGGVVQADLALLGGPDRSLLWSRQFVQPRAREADLRQQVAISAGRALNCGLEALNAQEAKLTAEVRKLYLSGCAGFDELAYGELHRMIPVMREVTRRAPGFAGAWGKLIQAEVLTLVAGAGDPRLIPQVKRDIADARRVNAHLAEAYLAEAELVPPDDFGERLRLTELATRHNPSHPEPYGARAYYLRFAGRMNDSVESAKRGAELNPLSPALHNDYITALSHAGEFDRAKQEIKRAERLWPGSSVVADARFRFNLRYGDPQLAVGDEQRGTTLWAPRVTKAFLRARIAPTLANVDLAVGEARALARQERSAIVVLIQVLGQFERKDELLSVLLDPASASDPQIPEILFRPTMRELRRDPRFMAVAKRHRLIDYWHRSGKWADFCFEPDLPYDCKVEAAKLG